MLSGEKSESSKTEAGPGNQGFGVGREGVEQGGGARVSEKTIPNNL